MRLVANLQFSDCKVKLWDLGGALDLHSIWTKYYKDCHGILFIIDSTDKERLKLAADVFCKVVIDFERLAAATTEGIPILVGANKMDCPDAMAIHEIKEILNPAFSHLSAKESGVMEISAIEGRGVKEMTEWITQKCKLNSQARPPVWL